VFQEGEEGLAVRLFMQRCAAIGVNDAQIVDLRADIEKALGPEKEAVLRSLHRPHWPHKLVKFRVRGPGRKVEVLTAALSVKSPGHGQGFDKRRFAGAVLADDKGHLWVEHQIVQLAHDREVEGVSIPIPPLPSLEPGREPVMRRIDAAHR
jgi:hypothetical protein